MPAADTGLNSQMTPEEQQSYLEKKQRQTAKTLETLGKQSKDTQAYLDALDQKIGYLRSQLKLTEQKVDTAENRITVLQKQQKKNRQDQAALQQQITDTKQQITVLDAQFQQNYQRYCQRLRAMYISGETNVLAFLLGSTDIGQLLTRYEMVARVAKQDTALLRSVQTEGTRLEQAKTEHAAAEVSEGGIFTPENREKPSVLGKLSVAKTQEKTPTAPGTAMKKKEDIQL